MSGETDRGEHVRNGLRKILDTHGYSFQYAVLKRAEVLAWEGRSCWSPELAEFPVNLNGSDTHIDFILRDRYGSKYLVAECKRANPALSNWCFVRAPYVTQTGRGERDLLVEKIMPTTGHTGSYY